MEAQAIPILRVANAAIAVAWNEIELRDLDGNRQRISTARG